MATVIARIAVRRRSRGPVKVDISKETTYLTEPIRKDGWIDYLGATKKGYTYLMKYSEPEDGKERFRRLGTGCLRKVIRWGKRTEDRAELIWGSTIRAQRLVFVKTDEGWKLNVSLPGE